MTENLTGTSAAVLLDSMAPCQARLTTMVLRFPRFILDQLGKHRMFSSNAASLRAIPTAKLIEQVETDPVVPVWWGKNQAGMQAKEALEQEEQRFAAGVWLSARDDAVINAGYLLKAGAHKQIVNRLLSPWLWTTAVVTGTEDAWAHFFYLRCDEASQPEMQQLAALARQAYQDSMPVPVRYGEWHLPFLQPDELDLSIEEKRELSVARTARVSYLTHEGRRDRSADRDLYRRLFESGREWSPYEHVAFALDTRQRVANFTGWKSWRHCQEGEYGQSGAR